MSYGATAPEISLGRGSVGLLQKPPCLIVEDQPLIGLALEAYLEEVGFADCETVPSAAKAMEWLSTRTPSVVILDYSLKDGPCLGLAHILRQAGIPFLIYSGHQRSIAPPEFHDVPWLTKPCARQALLAALLHAVPELGARLETDLRLAQGSLLQT